MTRVKGFANVVFPSRDLDAGVAAWTAILAQEPAFVGEDFAVFAGGGVEIGLTALPWVDGPLVFWKVDDIEESPSSARRPRGDRARRDLGRLPCRARDHRGRERRPGDRHRRRPWRSARGAQSPGRQPHRGHAGNGWVIRRVAVLSDVHDNAVALAAVLRELKEVAPDLVVFGGDLTWWPLPHETIALVDGAWNATNLRTGRCSARCRTAPDRLRPRRGDPPLSSIRRPARREDGGAAPHAALRRRGRGARRGSGVLWLIAASLSD